MKNVRRSFDWQHNESVVSVTRTPSGEFVVYDVVTEWEIDVSLF